MTCPCCQLHVHSSYSFKDGLSPVDDLVARAAELGQPGIALTDHGVLYGAPALFGACKKHGIKGVIGMEAYEAVPHEFDMERDGEIFKVKWADLEPGQFRYHHLTLWVMNEVGWRNLVALHNLSFSPEMLATQRGKPLIDRASLERHSEGLMVGLGCIASKTSAALANLGDEVAYQTAQWYAEVFEDRAYMEVMGNLPEQIALMRAQRKLAKRLGIPAVATNDVHYERQSDGVKNGPHHVLVQSRRFKKADTEESTDRADDGFGQWYGSDGFYLKDGDEMLATGFQRDEVERTVEILERVEFDFSQLPEPKPPRPLIPDDPAFEAWLSMRTEAELAEMTT